MPTNHVMVDLETQDSSGTAVIVAIGAVCFDPVTGQLGPEFSVNVDPESCIAIGLTRSESTMKWWAAQSAEAQAAWKVNPKSIQDALTDFKTFIHKNAGAKAYVYGNGATFDNVILRTAYTKANIQCPWPYYTDMCYRTMKNTFPQIVMQREGVHHNALSDAISQAKHLLAIHAFLNLSTAKPVVSNVDK